MNEEQLRQAGVATHTGFPNAAIGSSTKQLDLTKLLIRHPAATYLMRLDSNEWGQYGMFVGDIIIVDRSLSPRAQDSVIWWEATSFVISKKKSVPPDTPTWGVVTSVIHDFRR